MVGSLARSNQWSWLIFVFWERSSRLGSDSISCLWWSSIQKWVCDSKLLNSRAPQGFFDEKKNGAEGPRQRGGGGGQRAGDGSTHAAPRDVRAEWQRRWEHSSPDSRRGRPLFPRRQTQRERLSLGRSKAATSAKCSRASAEVFDMEASNWLRTEIFPWGVQGEIIPHAGGNM